MPKYLSDNINQDSEDFLESLQRERNKLSKTNLFEADEGEKQPLNNLLTDPTTVKILKHIEANKASYGEGYEYLTPETVAQIARELGDENPSYNLVCSIAEDPEGLLASLGVDSIDDVEIHDEVKLEPFSSKEDLEDMESGMNDDGMDLFGDEDIEKKDIKKESYKESRAPKHHLDLATSLHQLSKQLEDGVIEPRDVKNRIDRFLTMNESQLREALEIKVFDPKLFSEITQILESESLAHSIVNEVGNSIILSGEDNNLLEHEIKTVLEKYGILAGLDYDINEKNDFEESQGKNMIKLHKTNARKTLREYQDSADVSDEFLGDTPYISNTTAEDGNPETDIPTTLMYKDTDSGELEIEEADDMTGAAGDMKNDPEINDIGMAGENVGMADMEDENGAIVTRITDQDELAAIDVQVSDVHDDENSADLDAYEVSGGPIGDKTLVIVVDNDLDSDDGIIITSQPDEEGMVNIDEISNIVKAALDMAGLNTDTMEEADEDGNVMEYEPCCSIEEGPNSIFVKGSVDDILCAIVGDEAAQEIMMDMTKGGSEEELEASIATESLLARIKSHQSKF